MSGVFGHWRAISYSPRKMPDPGVLIERIHPLNVSRLASSMG
jgi:hypothetical protein